jgi:hypothetical protein
MVRPDQLLIQDNHWIIHEPGIMLHQEVPQPCTNFLLYSKISSETVFGMFPVINNAKTSA